MNLILLGKGQRHDMPVSVPNSASSERAILIGAVFKEGARTVATLDNVRRGRSEVPEPRPSVVAEEIEAVVHRANQGPTRHKSTNRNDRFVRVLCQPR